MSAKVTEIVNGFIRFALPFASRGTLITLGFFTALLLWERLAF